MIVLLGEKSVVPSGLHNGGSVTGGSASLTPGCNLSSRWDLKNEPRTRGCHFHPEGIFFKSLKG